jgi:signal transduction histidine kinase
MTLKPLVEWFRHGALANHQRDRDLASSGEARALRGLGALVLGAFILKAFNTAPEPGLDGRGAAVLIANVGFVLVVAGGIFATTRRSRLRELEFWPCALLVAMTAASAALEALQPNGSWETGPYIVAILAAVRFGRVSGAIALVALDAALVVFGAIEHNAAPTISLLALSTLPWFLMLRLLRRIREKNLALEASQVGEARAAAAAERGHLAREMHDVLAHSLSALALHLESTRLLAHDSDADPKLTRALDKAHQLAASGLQEARQVIAAARGDGVPGPERLGALVDAFCEQSSLPVDLQVLGEPRDLAPDAGLAVYRTAQEALTNVRRHATADRVDVRLDYRDDTTVLIVEDEANLGSPPLAGIAELGSGYGLVGMRERAELLGGSLLAEPTTGGFRVELRLPRTAAGERRGGADQRG